MSVQDDLDDYINSLHSKIAHLTSMLESYKKEVRTLRAEYAQMKQERDVALEDSTITEQT